MYGRLRFYTEGFYIAAYQNQVYHRAPWDRRTKMPARRDVAMPSCKIALDLSRAVQLDLRTLCSKQKFGFAKIFGSCHLHGAAQIRRGPGIDKWHILGAPRFSPYLARFLLAVSGRKQIVAPQPRLIIT